jgi:hypothetical protein
MPPLGQIARRREVILGWMALPLSVACLAIWRGLPL